MGRNNGIFVGGCHWWVCVVGLVLKGGRRLMEELDLGEEGRKKAI